MKLFLRLSILSILTGLVLPKPSFPNNINVSTPSLTGLNSTDLYVYVQFDLSWDNSFRDDVNWDAAWVFVKYQLTGSNEWKHAYLNTSANNHNIPAGYTCSVGLTEDYGIGVFVYRDAIGSGNTSLSNVQLRWEYGLNEVGSASTVTLKVFAIEMVYVPQGAFYVGDADNDTGGSFHDGDDSGPYYISSEDQIIVGTGDGELYYEGTSDVGDQSGPIPAAFPKGYNAFYCMKYETSQGQYTDFLHSLTLTQDSTCWFEWGVPPPERGRNTIDGPPGNRTVTRPDRAFNGSAWYLFTSYADWAGLRPMTELEFEKACRGMEIVVDDEYPWGNTSIYDATTLSGPEDGTETITDPDANCCWNEITYTGGDGGTGPLRCGIFATSSATRQESGSSYYGIMELAGNVTERIVTVGNAAGRAFTGNHGDGSLDVDGYANVINWPDNLTAQGSGLRGGNSGQWSLGPGGHSFPWGRVSNRSQAAETTGIIAHGGYGFRCVRTAP